MGAAAAVCGRDTSGRLTGAVGNSVPVKHQRSDDSPPPIHRFTNKSPKGVSSDSLSPRMRTSHIPSGNRRPPRSSRRSEHPVRKQYTGYLGDSDSPGELSNLRRATTRPVAGRLHRNVLSSSDSQYSCSEDSSDALSGVQRNHRGSSQLRLCRALRDLEFRKEVVLPGVFDGKDGTSFKFFLKECEQFFSTKYEGSERQQSKVMAQYLSGSAKQAYDAMDGARLKYSKLKPKLLEWYQGKKISVRRQADSIL